MAGKPQSLFLVAVLVVGVVGYVIFKPESSSEDNQLAEQAKVQYQQIKNESAQTQVKIQATLEDKALQAAAKNPDVEAVETDVDTAVQPIAQAVTEANTTVSDTDKVAQPPVIKQFVEGVHYKKASVGDPLQQTSTPKVVEFFWYGCPSCYQLESSLSKWLDNKPGQVKFEKVPATLGREVGYTHARIYYTAEALHQYGALKTFDNLFHLDVFTLIHKGGNHLASKKDIAAFFKARGVEEQLFNEMYDSFGVKAKVKKGHNKAAQYQVRGVPMIYVNDKYYTSPSLVNSFDEVIEVVDYLLQKDT